MIIKINQVFFILDARELSVKRKDLRASALMGLNQENPILGPLAVQHLNNQLFMNDPINDFFISFSVHVQKGCSAEPKLRVRGPNPRIGTSLGYHVSPNVG